MHHPLLQTTMLDLWDYHLLNSFTSHSTRRRYKTRANFNCKAQNLVCLMQCQICGMQSVRETGNALHTRMSSHHSDIRTKMLNKQVTAQPGFSIEDLEVMGTEILTKKITCHAENNRKATELRTLVPYGLTLTANSLGGTDSRNHDNTSMFIVCEYQCCQGC